MAVPSSKLGLIGLFLVASLVLTNASRNTQLLVFPGVHREQALDVLALTEHLVETRHYDAYVLVPDPLYPEFADSAIEPRASSEDAEDDAAEARGECTLEDNVRPGSLTLIKYPSVGFEEYQAHAKDSISELTSVLDFHLANCAGLMLNRTLLDSLAKPAGGGGAGFTALLGVARDPCATLLADKLRIRRRAAYDDGSSTSLLWGVLLGQGHATSHVAAYGTALGGGGGMGLYQRTRNVLQYYKVQMWHARVYGPRVAAFRSRHRVRQLYGEGPRPLPCHMKGQVIITGADWGLLEPQPLPPAVKLVGPLRAGPSAPGGAALQPPELAAHVAAAEHGVAVIAFPPDYRPPLRALLAVAEAVLDLKQHIVWQASEADIARVRQVYLPLKHARKVLMMPDVPVQDLLAHANVVSIITAGSVQAIYAAIHAAKPVMAVPLNAAQEDLVARLAALGAGQRLSRAELEGGAASYRVSVAIERMSNVYSFTASMQQLSTQLRAALGRSTALERAAAWVDYTAALDDLGRQYLQPLAAATGAAAPVAGGGGGCMGLVPASNSLAYMVIVGVGIGAAVLAGLVFHICTRVPPPPKRKARLVLKQDDADDAAEEREHERVEAEVVRKEQEREGLRERHRAKEREKERAREKERERERRRERERQQALRDIAAEREAEEEEERAARVRAVQFQRQEVEDVEEDEDDEDEQEQDDVDVPVRTSRAGGSKDKDA